MTLQQPVIERTRQLAESHARLEAEVIERRRAEEALAQAEASLRLYGREPAACR